MEAMKRLMETQDEPRGECQDCGAVCEVIQMNRRWCNKCWEAFANEYEAALMMQEAYNENRSENYYG